jgi:hypothetical protein
MTANRCDKALDFYCIENKTALRKNRSEDFLLKMKTDKNVQS